MNVPSADGSVPGRAEGGFSIRTYGEAIDCAFAGRVATRDRVAIQIPDEQVTSGRPGLMGLCQKIAQMNIGAARKLLAACDPEASLEQYQLQSSLRGRHRFSKEDLRHAVGSVLGKEHNLHPGPGDGGGMRFHLQVVDRRAMLGLQLTSNRSPGSLEREGVARPFVYCIGRLLDLGADATVVIDACGPDAHLHLWPSGPPYMAIGCHHERRRTQPDSRQGSEGVDSQVSNRVIRTVGLSTALPFGASRIDCIVTNQAGVPPPATKGSLLECARILKPEGIAVIITASPAQFVQQIMHGELPFAIGASLSAVVAGRKSSLCWRGSTSSLSAAFDPGTGFAWSVVNQSVRCRIGSFFATRHS